MELHISLPPALENRLQEEMAIGLYASASEVVQEALYSFLTPPEPEGLAAEMQRRVAAIEKGEVTLLDADTVFKEIFAWLDALPDTE